MSNEKDIKKQFAKRLNYYMDINDKKQIDLIKDLGATRSAVSSWCTGRRLPGIENIDMLAEYFNVKRSDLLVEKEPEEEHYYLHEETRKIAQELFKNKELRLLFDAVHDVKAEDLKLVYEMVKRMKK